MVIGQHSWSLCALPGSEQGRKLASPQPLFDWQQMRDPYPQACCYVCAGLAHTHVGPTGLPMISESEAPAGLTAILCSYNAGLHCGRPV